MPKMILDWKTANAFMIDAFTGVGVPRNEAKIVADVLLESDRRGIESHGCNRFKPMYIDRINAGVQYPKTKFQIIKETPTTAVVDGNHGMGQVIGYKAMSLAIKKAKKSVKVKRKASKYEGVYYEEGLFMWSAEVDGKELGLFESAEEAKKQRDEYLKNQ